MSDEQQADAAESQADAEDDVAEDAIQDGDFVRLAYTLRTTDDGRVVDTTDQETAEEAEIDTDEYEFEPRVIVVGAGHVFESVDEALIGAEVGDTGTVDIAAAEAFGEYDPEEVEGRFWEDLHPAEEVEHIRTHVLPVVRGGGEWSGRSRGLRSDGSTFTESKLVTALDDDRLLIAVSELRESDLNGDD